MKISILSREPRCYSTRRLREAALARGHAVRVLDTFALSVSLECGSPRIFYKGKELSGVRAVIPRIGASATFYGTAIVRQFEQMGTFVLSSSRAISTSRDKLHALQVLSRHRIGIAPTAFVRRFDEILPAIERVGGAPVIIKLLEGTQGNGVILADSARTAEAMISALQGAKQHVLIQKFVAESKGKDIRAIVVGGRVVAAMRRQAAGDDFRSNLHRGGRAEPIVLGPAYERAALDSARVLGLTVAGVDMLETQDGPQVLEVNSSPGLEGIERTTGVDVAGAIVDHVESAVRFPEVDVRHRLRLGSGFEIAEVKVARKSILAKKRLRDSGLEEAGIRILSIQRGGEVLMNPHGSDKVLPGDVLLCFGPRRELEGLLPSSRMVPSAATPSLAEPGSEGMPSEAMTPEPASVVEPVEETSARTPEDDRGGLAPASEAACDGRYEWGPDALRRVRSVLEEGAQRPSEV